MSEGTIVQIEIDKLDNSYINSSYMKHIEDNKDKEYRILVVKKYSLHPFMLDDIELSGIGFTAEQLRVVGEINK